MVMFKKTFKIGIILIISGLIIYIRYQAFFLRLPNRIIIEKSDIFLSPANGKIIAIINNIDSPVVKGHRTVVENAMKDTWTWSTMISIMMTPLNVHYQRAPQQGALIKQTYHTGKFLNAMNNNLNATFENEYNEMLFETPNHIKFKVIQIAGFMARRIVSFIKIWQHIKQGDVIGLIKMWSQVTIIFDKNIDILVKKWDIIHEWETVIGRKKDINN